MANMNVSDASSYIVQFLRDRPNADEVNLWGVIDDYIFKHEQDVAREQKVDGRRSALSPLFIEAAWDLAILGVLRPAGVRKIPDLGPFDATKYFVTTTGRGWIEEGEEDAFVPIGADTFIALLEPFDEFGEGFIERAREAAKCWKVKAFLACCVMCGAAAEAVLLAVAIARDRDEKKILQIYNSKGGRKKVEDLVTGQIRKELRASLAPLFELVKYWRDEAGHGGSSQIAQAEARTALQTLYLYAKLTHRNWSELVAAA